MANKTAKLMVYTEPEILADFKVAAALEGKKMAELACDLMVRKVESMRAKISAFRKLQAE